MEREYALLQQAEARYRMLFTLASEGVLIVDADSFNVPIPENQTQLYDKIVGKPVIFGIRRYQQSLMRFAETAAERGVTVVLFTDQWLSPIARIARHVVAARTSVPSPWDSSAALFVVIEALLGKITENTAPDSIRRIRDMEHMVPLGNFAAESDRD